MPDRSNEFRQAAAECIALARTTTDPATRATLLTMAQRWLTVANGSATNFDAIVRDFNDRQMSDAPKPVMQQQQQIQPKRDEDQG
jgi:hypothetical protein